MITITKIKRYLFCNALCFAISILNAQEKAIIGITNNGGSDNLGTIFKTDINGDNYTVLQDIKYNNPGAGPDNSKLCEVNGKLYGTTGYGGQYNKGTLYEYDLLTGIHTKLHDFDGQNTGRTPYSNVILASNGKLYGTTLDGGVNDVGTLFEYDITTRTLTKKLDFDGTTMGMDIYANVVQASNGKLYGLTNRGGAIGFGVLYEYDYTTESYAKLIDFDGTNNGSGPTILVEVEDGIMYGTTAGGGVNYSGTIFKYTIATNTLEKKFDFNSATSGSTPSLSLMLSSNGNLYGLTRNGGLNNSGTLYEFNISTATHTKKFDLTSALGSTPSGSLLEVENNKLLGLTNLGGANNDGVLFEYDIQSNTYSKKMDFEYISSGENPKGTLMQASNGKLYATAQFGGLGNRGILFEYDAQTNDFQKKLDFNYAENGYGFRAGFAKGLNGKLYITSSAGGLNGAWGTLLEYNPDDNTLIKKFDFSQTEAPQPSTDASVLYASNGKIYGVSTNFGQDVLFEFDLQTNTYASKVAFNTNGPSELMEANNNKIYGTTTYGGANNKGYLFEYDFNTNTFQNILDFDGTNTGTGLAKALFQASNGKLYGMSNSGGANNRGILFEFDIATNTFTKKHDFTTTFGGIGIGLSLIEIREGVLCGFYSGGSNGAGGIFEFDINTNTFTDKFAFDLTTGFYPQFRLLKTSENKLFGLNNGSGPNNNGVLFEFDPATNVFTNKFDFPGTTGSRPIGAPIEVTINGSLSVNEIDDQKSIRLYPNPVTDELKISSKLSETLQIKVYDVLGKQVISKTLAANNKMLNVKHLKSGLYIFKATSQTGKTETVKFIKN